MNPSVVEYPVRDFRLEEYVVSKDKFGIWHQEPDLVSARIVHNHLTFTIAHRQVRTIRRISHSGNGASICRQG